jgi:hypothetical protein
MNQHDLAKKNKIVSTETKPTNLYILKRVIDVNGL